MRGADERLIPLLGLGLWAGRVAPARTRVFYLLAPPLSSAVLLLDPGLEEYRGLSGIVMGLATLLALHQLRHDRGPAHRIWPMVLAVIAVKLAWELWRGTAVFASFSAGESVRVVPLAHVAGVTVAMVIHLWPRTRAAAG